MTMSMFADVLVDNNFLIASAALLRVRLGLMLNVFLAWVFFNKFYPLPRTVRAYAASSQSVYASEAYCAYAGGW